MSHFNPNEPLIPQEPLQEDIDSNLSIETKKRTEALEAIRALSWHNRIFRGIQKGSLRGVVIIFIRLCLGAGIFTLPFYVQSYGYVLGGVLIFLAGVLNLFSYYDIIEAADESKSANYFELIKEYLGTKMQAIFKVTYFFDLSATVIAVFVICYNLLQFCMAFLGMVPEGWYEDRAKGKWSEYHPDVMKVRGAFLIIILGLSVPFLLQKELFYLQKVNYLVLLALVLLIGYILAESPFFWLAYRTKTTTEAIKDFRTDWFENFFALMLSFYAQPYVFSLKSELTYPTVARMKKTTRITMGLEIIIFLGVGIIGYLALGDKFTPEVLYARQQYEGKSPLSEWVYRGILIFYFACVLVGLAVYNPTIREAIYDLIPSGKDKKGFYTLTSLIPFVLYALVAFAKPRVVFIFNFTGVTVSNFNGFILPAVIQAVRQKRQGNNKGMILPLTKVVLFIIFGGLGLYFMIKNAFSG